MNRVDFSVRYCEGHDAGYGYNESGSSHTLEMNYMLSKGFMIRRRKDQVLKELPPKQRQRIYLTLSGKNKDLIDDGLKSMKSASSELRRATDLLTYSDVNFDKNKQWMQMYKKTGMAKLEPIKEYLKETVLETKEKFLIFAHHRDVMDGLEECMKKNKVEYIRIDGHTPPKKRDEFVQRFQTDKKCQCAILSILAAGTGYTMTASSMVIFAELHFTPGVLLQCEDRVHRIGQKSNSVTIKYLLGAGTLDDTQLWPLLEKKVNVVGETVDGEIDRSDHWNGEHMSYDKMNSNDQDDENDHNDDSDESSDPSNQDDEFDDIQDELDVKIDREEEIEMDVSEEEFVFQDDLDEIVTQPLSSEPKPTPPPPTTRTKSTTGVTGATINSKNLLENFLFKKSSTDELPFNVLNKTKEYQFNRTFADVKEAKEDSEEFRIFNQSWR
ncbi:hypothetical protein AKO1_003787 [Acrasis kona]|uniref:Helicase C-terminal domain-containing protein n=1 Tax=Acrasis kona TaxID=1008807 RepID=A0AAW2Z6B5_9EUKA